MILPLILVLSGWAAQDAQAQTYRSILSQLGPGAIPHVTVIDHVQGPCWNYVDSAAETAQSELSKAFDVVVVSDQAAGSFQVVISATGRALFTNGEGCIGSLLVTFRKPIDWNGEKQILELSPPKSYLIVDRGSLDMQIREHIRVAIQGFIKRIEASRPSE